MSAETAGKPKWMLEIEGQSLAQHLINCLQENNITDVTLVTGPLGGSVKTPSVATVRSYANANMLQTLFSIRDLVVDDVIFCYCDLLLEPRVFSELLRNNTDAGIVVDRNWLELFSLRSENPEGIAESLSVESGRIVEIGQPLNPSQTPSHQYIGVMKFSEGLFRKLTEIYDELCKSFEDKPWRNAARFEEAYLTDFLQELVDRGINLTAVEVEGGWFEFDTPADLKAAMGVIENPNKGIFDFETLPPYPVVVSAGGVAVRNVGSDIEVLLVGSGAKGEWRVPKGMLEAGETKEAAASREVFEETGVAVKVGDSLQRETWVYWYDEVCWREYCYFFSLEAISNGEPRPDSEHSVAAWLSANSAMAGMKFEQERNALASTLAHFEGAAND
jgi:choline kinase/8-oxo-dGTP pyrophosphatase MutT (NUDIX family)